MWEDKQRSDDEELEGGFGGGGRGGGWGWNGVC